MISFTEAAYYYCENLTKSNYENFPVASYFVPKNKRKYIFSIYAFARTADNIADSIYLKPADKMEKLEFMEDLLLNFGDYDDTLDMHFRNIFVALHDTINLLNLRNDDLLNLLKAFKQDAVKNRYDKYEDILNYSDNSANPVGRLVLRVFDYDYEKDKNLYKFSDYICSALQLTNFWQDISVDLKMNRVYIPIEIMDKYGYSLDDLYLKVENDKFRKVMKDLVDRTEQMFLNGRELTDHLKGRLRMEIKATVQGGMKILDLIKDSNYKVLSSRVKLSKIDKIKIMTTSVF
ncbi:MAG: squalene synthase HpnC [Ignavibacteria bacterium]